MTTHIARDYASATSGYVTALFHTPFLYNLSIFLNKILGYSVVGQTGFDINNTNSQTFTNSATTPIAVASNGQILPQSTINVGSTTGFPASGTIYVATTTGTQIVKYSGTTSTTFTNCTGGTGTMSSGASTTTTTVQTLPTASITVTSTVGFATSGTIYIITTTGPQLITYTNTDPTHFLGCTGGTGNTSNGGAVTNALGGSVTCGQNKILTATGAPWTITTTFPHGMSSGDYAFISTGGAISSAFSPYPVQVVNSTTLTLINSAGGSGYVTNSQTLFPPGVLIASGTLAGGTGASINFAGAPSVNAVQIPTTIRTVVSGTAPSTGDVGRMLVLKSPLYPTKNTGIYKISTVNTATNSYTVDYRSTDTPPTENGTLDWWLYEVETQTSNYLLLPDDSRTSIGLLATTNTAPIQVTFNLNGTAYFQTGQRVTIAGVTGNTNANGTWTITLNGANTFLLNGSVGNGTSGAVGTVARVGYSGGDNNSPNSKVILQSPHSSAWQVRIAVEPFNVPGVVGYSSVTVGYGGSAQGDWSPGGVTTHIPQFLDVNIPNGSIYANTLIGSANSQNSPRVTIVGDSGGQSVCLYTRTQNTGANGFLLFGLPDNEPTPLPINFNRPFTYGSCSGALPDYGGIQMRFGATKNIGFTFRDLVPEMCAIAGFVNADGVSAASPTYSANAGDCPFTGTTEVIPWEIWGGIATDPTSFGLPFPSGGVTVYSLNQRFMGTAPFIRQGRANFSTFTLSTDNTTAFSISTTSGNAVSPIQVTTSATNSLVTGQTVVISGVVGNTNANGTFVITVINNTNFTLNGTTGNANYVSGGSGNGTQQWLHLQNGIFLAWNGAGGLTP